MLDHYWIKGSASAHRGYVRSRLQTPRSVQMNIGVQREIRPGMIFSADFLRNVQTHYFLGIDENHAGDVHYFDRAAALQAISATNQSFGCGAGDGFNGIQCAIAAGAQMADYANNGLTSSSDFDTICSFPSVTIANTKYGCAFSGVNPKAPALPFLNPLAAPFITGCRPNSPRPLKTRWVVCAP